MKVWTAIDGLLIIWKSDLSIKIKWNYFQVVAVSILLYRCTTWMLIQCIEKKWDGNYSRMLQILEAITQEKFAVWSLTSHLKNHPNETNKICGTLLEKQGWTHKWCFLLFSTQCQCWLISKNTGYSLENLSGMMDERDG